MSELEHLQTVIQNVAFRMSGWWLHHSIQRQQKCEIVFKAIGWKFIVGRC